MKNNCIFLSGYTRCVHKREQDFKNKHPRCSHKSEEDCPYYCEWYKSLSKEERLKVDALKDAQKPSKKRGGV